MSSILLSLCFILVSMVCSLALSVILVSMVSSLAFSVGDRSKCVFVMCVASALLMHVLFRYSLFSLVASLGTLSSVYYLLNLEAKKGRPSRSKKEETQNLASAEECQQHARGSFLLDTGNKKLRKSIVNARMNLDKMKDGSSCKLGKKLIAKRKESLGPNVSCFYADEGGLVITRGEGSYLIDPDGNRYLDCCNNVAAVGHSHPKVVDAGINALSKIQTNSRFLHPSHQRYIDKLLMTFPSELDTVYLVNSGSEANDLALRIAKAHAEMKGIASKPNDVICLDSAYHGTTQSLVDISPYKWHQSVDGKEYKGMHTHVATLPDSFRGKYRGWSKETGLAYAKEVKDIVEHNGGVGVFIVESVVGCGGQVCLPPGYLSACHDVVRDHGGVLIVDEIQTGFARSGEKFWHFQTFGVVPDIVTFGKPCGNGTYGYCVNTKII
jgi:4-aminobutyrate aminotransferase-like enzyme